MPLASSVDLVIQKAESGSAVSDNMSIRYLSPFTEAGPSQIEGTTVDDESVQSYSAAAGKFVSLSWSKLLFLVSDLFDVRD